MDELAKKEESKLAQTEIGGLLQLAINKDMDTDKLQQLIDLKNKEEERQAEREFEFHFAEMQKEYIPAYKKRSVSTNSGAHAFNYCPLPEILKVYAPILSKHGFSYRWAEDEQEGAIKVTCFLTGYGHTRTASKVIPYGESNQLVNKIQTRGISTEYGRRYTYMNVTGCIVAEDDTDGQLPQEDISKIKSDINHMLTFIPKGLRAELVAEINKINPENAQGLFNKTKSIKDDCQKILKAAQAANNEKGKKIIAALPNIETGDELLDWLADSENL